ncbi:MAG: glycerate kinase [Tannerella sp.]|jgi:glycerate kinase|nr:glycerate kinase [Tannerella sp.]
MKKIVIASDSFKGCLSSLEITHAAEAGIRKVLPACEVVGIPVADGGEGTTEALVDAMNGRFVSCEVHDPLMNVIQVEYGILGDGHTAVFEMASASGLTLVPPDKRNPMLTTTYGTGEIIRDALQRGCRRFLIGIGGSATNDAGTGMLQALGYRFFDQTGNELGQGGQILEQIDSIDSSNAHPALKESIFTIACDVNNPFSGENGAAYIYGPQKGADADMVRQLDKGLKHFATVIRTFSGKDIDPISGAGAAGGLGGGFLAFLSGTLKRGILMVLEALDFDNRIQYADLIITGEGKLDRQTGMGKTPAGVLEAGRRQQIPVVAIGGALENSDALIKQGFLAALSIQPGPVSLDQAMDKAFAATHVERVVEQILRLMNREGNS